MNVLALVCFCVGVLALLAHKYSECWHRAYYRGIREQIKEALGAIEEYWQGEPMSPSTVSTILVLIYKRQAIIDYAGLRLREGGQCEH